MTTFTRKCVSEDYDVFTVPHSRMKQILNEVSKKIEHTDFTNSASFSNLLADLMKTFLELKHHEEIENKYIMKILKQKLHGEALKRLLEHLHAHSHIADILSRVRKTKRQLNSGTNVDLQRKSSKLNAQLRSFFDEYFPHMIEEEQVLQPMLLEFLSPTELRHIRSIVIELHQTEDDISEKLAKLSTTEAITQEIADNDLKLPLLPEEVLATIFSYLDPRELCRCAQVCRSWNHATRDGQLWSVIQPSRWAQGDLSFGSSDLASDDCNCDCQPNYDLSTFRESPAQSSSGTSSSDETTSLKDFSDGDTTDSLVRRETRILHGLSRHVFPKVGNSVKILTLECSKAITNGMLFRLLSQCGNLEYLDVSQTIISDFGLMGLFKHENSNLKYLDVSGCKNVTDKVLVKLSQSMGKLTNSKSCQCQPNELTVESDHGQRVRLLHTLRLSGCFKITDHGLRALSKYGGLPYLKHLDLSGCVNITTNGIKELVNTCKALKEVFYCDNLDDVTTISSLGCQNCECSHRVCCRNISADVKMSA